MSLWASGTPASGPAASPRPRFLSISRARASASSPSRRTKAWRSGSSRSMRASAASTRSVAESWPLATASAASQRLSGRDLVCRPRPHLCRRQSRQPCRCPPARRRQWSSTRAALARRRRAAGRSRDRAARPRPPRASWPSSIGSSATRSSVSGMRWHSSFSRPIVSLLIAMAPFLMPCAPPPPLCARRPRPTSAARHRRWTAARGSRSRRCAAAALHSRWSRY